MSDCCVTILCPPMQEERLLDLLLTFAASEIFTSVPLAAHGVSSGHMSAAEQVRGRARATQVQVLLTAQAKDGLLAEIRQQFPGVHFRYWAVPIMDMGKIE